MGRRGGGGRPTKQQSILSADVYGTAADGAEGGSNQLVLTADDLRRRKQQAAADKARKQAAEAKAEKEATPMSKSQARKLAQIQARKEKEKAREAVLASLKTNRMDNSKLMLLGSSASLGHTKTKKQELQRALYAKKQGAELEGLVSLEVERNQPEPET
eukprot:3115114-Prymnesium_polylepis.2